MSRSPGEKPNSRDRSSHPDISYPELSGPQSPVVTEELKKKKRKSAVLYTGSSDTEVTPKRKQEQHGETKSVPPAPKRRKNGDVIIEEQTEQGISRKKEKKKGKEESHREEEDTRADDKIKKSHKAKESKSGQRDEEAPDSAELDGRSRTKKKKKKDGGEHPLDDCLVEESLTSDSQSSNKKKKTKRKDGGEESQSQQSFPKRKHQGGFEATENVNKRENQAKDNQELPISETQHSRKKKKKCKDGGGLPEDGFSEEPLNQKKHPNGSETLEQVEKPAKKKKKKIDLHQEKDDIAVDASSSFIGLHVEESLYSELIDVEDRPSRKKKKKSKKDFDNPHIEGLMEESMTTNTVDAIKKKKRQHGEGLREDGFISQRTSSDDPEREAESTDQAEKPMKKKKKKRKDESHREVDGTSADDEASFIVLHQDTPEKIKKAKKPKSLVLPKELLNSVKKKSKKDRLVGDGLVEESTLSKKTINWKDGGAEGQRQHVQEGESVDQAEAHGKKKKKQKKDRGEPQQEADLTVSFSGGLLSEEHSCSELAGTEDKASRKKKKKSKRDRGEPHQEPDLTVDDVSSSGGLHSEEASCSELAGTEDRPSRKKKKKSKKHHRDRLLEEGLVEESLTLDVHHTSEKKAKRKDGGHENNRHQGFTEEVGSTKSKQQDGPKKKGQADENEEMAEKPEKKKKKRKGELPHEADDAASEEVSSTLGLRGEEPSHTEFPASEDTSTRTKKEKSKDQHRECLLENDLVEADTDQSHRPLTPASSDADQNPATGDERQIAQTEGQEGPAALKANTGKRRTGVTFALRPQDVALINEFLPRLKDEATMKHICCYELERMKAAKRLGIMFRSGQFTVDEDEQIRKNVHGFASQFGIESPQMLLHPYLFPEVKDIIFKLKSRYQFRTRVAEGLHRFAFHVYFRAVKLFAPLTKAGRFSNEEVALLKTNREVFGNKWRVIAHALNRDYGSIRMKSTQLREGNSGVWSTEETNRLITVMKEIILDPLRKEKNGEELVTVPKRRLDTGIPWFVVERKVETRVWTACRTRWYNLMMMRMNNYIHPFGKTLKCKASMRIIQWLYDRNVKDYGDVKWHELSDYIGNVPVTLMQRHFHTLKLNVAGWKHMRLYEIVQQLYDEQLPKLELQLAAAEEVDVEPETKNEFLISEIFKEYFDCGEKFEA